jgi:hypothetical protein
MPPQVRYRRYPFVAWWRLKPSIVWKQGQHVFCSGATNTGKSTVAGEFLSRRKLVVVCVSKGQDPIFDQPPYKEYERIKRWPPPRRAERCLLWPANAATSEATRQNKTKVFREALDDILLHRGQWCIDIDETHYMSETLRLKAEIADILEQGRSANISMWNNTQRPAGIPLAVYVNSAHAFLFQSQEEYDLDRLARMASKHSSRKELELNLSALESMDTHEFIYIDRTGKIPPVRSIVEKQNLRRKSSASNRQVSSRPDPDRERVA